MKIQTAPTHVIFSKGDIKTTLEVVYFKRHNQQILVEHLDQEMKRHRELGYSVEIKTTGVGTSSVY